MVEENNQQVKFLRLFLSTIILALVICGAYLILSPFITPILWAIVIVTTSWPLYRRLCRIFPRYRGFSALLMTTLLAIVICTIVIPVVITLSRELGQFSQHFKSTFSNDLSLNSISLSIAEVVGTEYLPTIQDLLSKIVKQQNEILGFITSHQGSLFGFVKAAAVGIFGLVVNLLIFLLTSFYLYRNGPNLARHLELTLHSIGGERLEKMVWSVRDTVKAAVYGIVATAIGQGILAGIGYIIAGAPVPILLGFLTILFSLIPFGTPFVYVPVSFLLISQGSTLAGILLLVWGVCVVSMVDNLLRPIFISQATKMPFIMVLFGVVGGVLSFGFIGVILGPVILAIIAGLWQQWVLCTESKSSESKNS